MVANLLLAAFAAAQPPPGDARPRFEGMFTQWQSASRESVEAERRALARPPAAAPAGPAASGAIYVPGSPELGRRVGEIVALGDCGEGERVARAAGDFALVAAVRAHCQDKAAAPR